jgi:hypothetical protein
MSEGFCHNEKCCLNKYDGDTYSIDIEENGKKVTFFRYMWRNGKAKKIYLCDVCHNAVKMIMK